ncbi:hypothetical protein ARMSODRAFT_1026708 [Armillaria solidipes]|uniref:Uncharacterized protein n=1 Tax=Armillaria solidipes TaxID=1076256 RepID=A0A2H3ARS0_9AGAR|nr:hypothetical protein ARMSODRAFT_1026708 [Armillaria solidipes]
MEPSRGLNLRLFARLLSGCLVNAVSPYTQLEDALEDIFLCVLLRMADSFAPLDTPSIDQRQRVFQSTALPSALAPVLVGEDNPPFEGAFEFPGTGTREEEKGSQTAPFKVILEVFQPSLPVWRRLSFGRQTRLLKSHDARTDQYLRKKNKEHLGFGKESDTQDKLDERLAQYTRFVYKLQESDTASSSSDDESWDSDESVGRRRHRSRRKQRMSLLTGQYFDVAHNQTSRRKFFQSRVVFDDTWQRVKLVQELRLGFGVSDLAGLMERGGGDGEDDWIEMDT